MAVPLIKIYNAIKNDYENVELSQDYIVIPLEPRFHLDLTIYNDWMAIYSSDGNLHLSYSDEDDLVEIQNDIYEAVIFIKKLFEKIYKNLPLYQWQNLGTTGGK